MRAIDRALAVFAKQSVTRYIMDAAHTSIHKPLHGLTQRLPLRACC